MPIYRFKCDKDHVVEVFRNKPYRRYVKRRCKECGLFLKRDIVGEYRKRKELHLDHKRDPISHLLKKRSFKHIWVEHLTPEPVLVRDKNQYHRLLKETHSREAIS